MCSDPPAALLMCASPFGEYARPHGREYRGVRTKRYTYVRDLTGPWLLYDNESDRYQVRNLCDTPAAADVQARLESILQRKLAETGDGFLPGDEYIRKWGCTVDETGTVPYTT